MLRIVTPEILDELPPGDAAAEASRRDLTAINRVMGNYEWFGRRLPRLVRAEERVLEIGAGNGELAEHVPSSLRVDGLDCWPRPARLKPDRRWHQTDLFEFRSWPEYPVVVANLFLHHFSAGQIGEIGTSVGRHARVFLASEPNRSRLSQGLFALLCRALRLHPITRHDGHVSIAAGFNKSELPALLKLDPAVWNWKETSTLRGAYRLEAVRKS